MTGLGTLLRHPIAGAAGDIRSAEGAIVSHLEADGALIEQSIRFTLGVLVPIIVAMFVGPEPWLLFGMIGAVVSFAADAGGKPVERLAWMATAPLALALGMALGSLTFGDMGLVLVLSIAAAFLYGLVENGHPHLLLAARFFAFGTAFAGLFGRIGAASYVALAIMLVIAWAISLGMEVATGKPRPLSVPDWRKLGGGLALARPERWAFALAVAFAVGLALAITLWIGSSRPAWASLTVLIVMRSEIASSHRLALEWTIGTLLGVLAALALIPHLDHRGILIVMAVAAFIRWPAQQLMSMLGVFCLMLFFMLAIDFVSAGAGQAGPLLVERVYDTLIGALSAAAMLSLYQRALPRLLRMKAVG